MWLPFFRLALLGAILTGCGQPSATTAPATAETFAALTGRWVRPDGGYILEVQEVAPDGLAKVGYFNPRPIRVSAARATQAGATLNLFVELRDEGYPGCTYQLTYDAAHDQLHGVYFQAAQQQRFAIVFERAMPPLKRVGQFAPGHMRGATFDAVLFKDNPSRLDAAIYANRAHYINTKDKLEHHRRGLRACAGLGPPHRDHAGPQEDHG